MIRFLIRAALVVLVFVTVLAVARGQPTPEPAAVIVQAAHESGLSAKGSDLTWPTAAAVTAWRFIDLLHKAVDQLVILCNKWLDIFGRWLDKTEGRIPISIRQTAVSTHTEVDPDPTKPIIVNTTEYTGPDRRQKARRKPSLVERDDDPNNR